MNSGLAPQFLISLDLCLILNQETKTQQEKRKTLLKLCSLPDGLTATELKKKNKFMTITSETKIQILEHKAFKAITQQLHIGINNTHLLLLAGNPTSGPGAFFQS